MKILLTPKDVIERALWDDFEYYVLDKYISEDMTKEEFVSANEEFEIGENDALVIGLLKNVETENLSHKLNQYITTFFSNRAFNRDKKYYVKKKLMLDTLEKFDNKFPDFWNPNAMYTESLRLMREYKELLISRIDNLKVFEMTDNFGTHEILEINHLKKILEHHH